jgi:osmotically-inducible protein OsmY
MRVSTATKGVEMSNEDVKGQVTDELLWDPKVDKTAVGVTVDGGVVTLRGTVGSFREVSSWADHNQAVEVAWAAPGVTRVKDHIRVFY